MAGRFYHSFGHLTTDTEARKVQGISKISGLTSLLARVVAATQTDATTDLAGGWDGKGCFKNASEAVAQGPRIYPGDLGEGENLLSANRDEWFVTFRLKYASLNEYKQDRCIFSFLDTNTVLGYLTVNQNGTITYTAVGASTETDIATSTYALNPDTYYCITAHVKVSATGYCAVYVNSVANEVLSVAATTALNTGNSGTPATTCNTFDIWGPAGLSTIDDVVIYDASTTDGHGYPDPLTPNAVTNKPPTGDLRVYPLSPTGAGTTTGWTPSAGANWDCVEEKSLSDANYVSTALTGLVDTYACEDLTGTIGAVYGVQLNNVAQKDQPDEKTLQGALRPGLVGSDVTGVTHTLTTAWHDYRDIWGVQPWSGNAVWDETAINAMEIGQKS